MSQDEKNNPKEEKKEEQKLNKDAQEFIPSKKKNQEKLNFNLEAKEYKPKPPKEKIEYIEADDDEEEDIVKDEIDMMMRDEIENEAMNELAEQGKISDDSADEEKWFPKYKDCECCHGFVYKCKGDTCSSLGQCFCKMKDDVDDDGDKEKDKN